jgi:hypothetical protein
MRVAYNGSARLSLDAIEHAVHEAHEAITRNDQDSLTRAMKAGDGLIEIRARQLIGHGQWGDLYRRTCGSVRTAQIYVKLAKARLFLKANAQSSACLSIDAALRFLRQHDGTSRPKTKKEATASGGARGQPHPDPEAGALDEQRRGGRRRARPDQSEAREQRFRSARHQHRTRGRAHEAHRIVSRISREDRRGSGRPGRKRAHR